jgi:7,8-dihydropterin-6-yl-methyl-4-(beta-D-ribofuranosyl)aminobenzene 5'-phosphate synthase
VPRAGIEHLLPNTWSKFGISDGLGGDANICGNRHFTEDELAGKPQLDQHGHEHATCFRLGDRSLVVISSCGHAGIINTSRRAGGQRRENLCADRRFPSAPARQVMAELKNSISSTSSRCIAAAKQEMPAKLVLFTTGSRFIFYEIKQKLPVARDRVRSLPGPGMLNQCRKPKSHKRWNCST